MRSTTVNLLHVCATRYGGQRHQDLSNLPVLGVNAQYSLHLAMAMGSVVVDVSAYRMTEAVTIALALRSNVAAAVATMTVAHRSS